MLPREQQSYGKRPYHGAPHARHSMPHNYKSESRYGAKQHSPRAAPTPAAAAKAMPEPSAREEALRAALTKALANPTHTSTGSSTDVDEYGMGAATDRLQFGYCPAVAAEAVAYHSRFSPTDWVAARKQNGQMTIVTGAKMPHPNFEPLISTLKLQRHWKKINAFQSDVRGGKSKMKAAELDQLLDMLASKQRVDEDEE